MIPICIPLHHGGGKHRDDTELRFALRSLEKHFKGELRIVIIGQKLPAWIQNVEHLAQTNPNKSGLKAAVRQAAAAFPDGFFWFYDDCCLLRDTLAETMRSVPCSKSWQKSGTTWGRMLETIKVRLEKEGFKAWDYSHPHGPYFFDKSMVDEGFRDWPGMKGKFPWETWILSKRDWPRLHGSVVQFYGGFDPSRVAGKRYLNYNGKGNTLELRDWLREKFPQPSRFESSEEMTKKQIYAQQALHLFRIWEKEGSPQLRTMCECAVGPWSLLAPLEGKAERTVMIEPDPVMAANARRNYPWAEIHQVAIAETAGTANLRKLNGASYIKGIAWAPAFDACPRRAKKAGKVAVSTIPFTLVDDGKIDLINLDCEGSEWFVLKNMVSRPAFLQIEIYEKHGHYREIMAWLEENGYFERKRWGNANRIFLRRSDQSSL